MIKKSYYIQEYDVYISFLHVMMPELRSTQCKRKAMYRNDLKQDLHNEVKLHRSHKWSCKSIIFTRTVLSPLILLNVLLCCVSLYRS